MKKDVSPIMMMYWGVPSKSDGGPRRIVAELLEYFLQSNRDIERLAFVSSNAVISDNALLNLDRVQQKRRLGPSSWLKDAIADFLNRTTYGIHLQLLRNRRRLSRHIRELGTDFQVLHSHDPVASGLIFPESTHLRIATHHAKGSFLKDTLHQVFPFARKTFLESHFEELERNGMRAADIITFPSKGAQRIFEADYPDLLVGKRVEIVYNGVEVDQFIVTDRRYEAGHEEKPFTILNVAAHSEEKRFDLVIETVSELVRRRLPVLLVNAGDGVLKAKHEAMVKEKGLDNNVQFLGKVPQDVVKKRMRDSDMHFLPSERVVFDMITLETMAAGLPVLVSRDGGNLEVIENGVNGIMCETGKVAQFADAITNLMSDTSLRRKLGENAAKTVRTQFSRQRMCESYSRLYHETTRQE